MKTTRKLHDLGQSIWLDNITRDLLHDGTLARYLDELSVTGLTSNPMYRDPGTREGLGAIEEPIFAGIWVSTGTNDPMPRTSST